MADTEVKEPSFKDPMQEMTYKGLVELINEYNSIVSNLNAASGDRVSLTDEITEKSTDPKIVKAREERDAAIMRLDELVRPEVEKRIQNASGDLEAQTEKVKELNGTIKPGLSYYAKLYGEDTKDTFPQLVRARSARIGSSGTGGRRIRGFNLIVTVGEDIQEFENFSSAAKWIGVETATLQDKFFEAAKTDKVDDIPDKVSFSAVFSSADEDGKEESVEASVVAVRQAEK